MMKHKKPIIAILIVILTSLLAYIGYCTIRYFIIWNKIEHSPIFHTLSDEEIEYFSEQSALPLKNGTILSYQYHNNWREFDTAEIYISVSNDKKGEFLNQAKTTYYEETGTAAPDILYYNEKGFVKWYQRCKPWCCLYEFEEEEEITVFAISMHIEDDTLYELTWNKLKAGEGFENKGKRSNINAS